jgi:hypothetical protein
MDFPEVFATSLVVILPAFLFHFKEKISFVLVFVAILLALAITTLTGAKPPSINPLSVIGTVLWQLVGALQSQ